MRVSVVMPSFNSERTIEASLAALARQTFRDFETLVVDSSPGDEVEHLVRSRFPDVGVERARRRLHPHEARNRGAERAQGELIVFTDSDCAPHPEWLDRLVSAHEAGAQIVGGAIEPAGGARRTRGMHRCKFGAWESRTGPGERHMLPTANLLLARSAWEDVGPFRLLGWSGDTELCWRARAAGYALTFEPSAVVEHQQDPGIAAFCRERVARGRAFAELRASAEGWSRARAAVALARAPAVPLVLIARDRPTAPAVQLAGYTAWALGEARAHLARVGAR